jgi:predicted RNase H-like HicB family nuclease
MNMPISFATGNYFEGSTRSIQNSFNWMLIEMININECDMEDFKLNTPISVRLEKDYNDWVASDSITGVYSFGNTKEDAKKNFCYSLEDVYKFLSEDLDNLTSINKNTYEYLKNILSKK